MAGRLTQKRGSYYTQAPGGVKIDVSEVALPIHSFSANWCRATWDRGSVLLSFGMRSPFGGGGRLFALLVVRVSAERIRDMVRGSEAFLQDLLVDAASIQPVDDAPVPEPDKMILYDANVVNMSFSGNQAEMDFYNVPSHDIAVITRGLKESFHGPKGVVSVGLTKSDLASLFTGLMATMPELVHAG